MTVKRIRKEMERLNEKKSSRLNTGWRKRRVVMKRIKKNKKDYHVRKKRVKV